MTYHGLCHNATFDKSRLSVGHAKILLPWMARSITYYRDDWSSWRATLGVMRDLANLGIKNLLLANTEATGCILKDHEGQQRRLRMLLSLARDEFSYYDNTTQQWRAPIHYEEPENEVDTPGWNDGAGGFITAQLVYNNAIAHQEVCKDFGIETLGPSFLGGPSDDIIKAAMWLFASDPEKRISKFTWHPYGKSINSQPNTDGIFGDLATGCDELLGHAGDYTHMQLVLSEAGWWTKAGDFGAAGQKRYVREFCKFQHSGVFAMCYFAENDYCPTEAELNAGKDFGLVDINDNVKPAYAAFKGELAVIKPQPAQPIYVLGFNEFYNKLRAGGIDPGSPLENEWGPWPYLQQQRTYSDGMFTWANLKDQGGRLAYTHGDGRRFKWDGSSTTYQEVNRDDSRG